MTCDWLLILIRGREETIHRFHGCIEEEAIKEAEKRINKEHRERQEEFPFTPELPAKAILFRGFREW